MSATGPLGERAELGSIEREVVLVDAFDAALGLETGQRHGRIDASREYEVCVGRKVGDQPGEERGPTRALGDLMGVVEDEADLRGGGPGDRVGDGVERRIGAEPERLGDAAAEVVRLGIGGFATDPDVAPPRRDMVLVDRLGQGRGLAEPGAGPDDHDAGLEPGQETPEHRRAQERVADVGRLRAERPGHADVHVTATVPVTHPRLQLPCHQGVTRCRTTDGPIRRQGTGNSGRYKKNRRNIEQNPPNLTRGGRFRKTTAERGCDIRLRSAKPTREKGSGYGNAGYGNAQRNVRVAAQGGVQGSSGRGVLPAAESRTSR